MRRVLLVVLAFVFCFSLAAGAADPIRIGVNLEMTGAVAAYGQMGWEGIQTAYEILPKEVLGRPIELVLVDNKSDKVEAANATSRLIEKEKVVAIIGTMTSGNMLAAGPIAEKYKVPIIGPSTTNDLTTQGKQFVFRACFADSDQGRIAANYAYNVLGARSAAILSDIANDYCVALGQIFNQEFKAHGGKVVSNQFIRAGDQDFSAQLTSIKTANPDVLYVPNYYTEDALVAIQARALGLEVPVLLSDGADAPEFFQIGKDAVNGMMNVAFWHKDAATNGLGQKYAETYQKKYDKEPNAFGIVSADAYMIVVEAIKRAGSADPVKVREAMEATQDLDVFTGKLTIEDGSAIKTAVIRKANNGNWDYVDTVAPNSL